jgi:hypothetical protein
MRELAGGAGTEEAETPQALMKGGAKSRRLYYFKPSARSCPLSHLGQAAPPFRPAVAAAGEFGHQAARGGFGLAGHSGESGRPIAALLGPPNGSKDEQGNPEDARGRTKLRRIGVVIARAEIQIPQAGYRGGRVGRNSSSDTSHDSHRRACMSPWNIPQASEGLVGIALSATLS